MKKQKAKEDGGGFFVSFLQDLNVYLQKYSMFADEY
jgi:hypothetical protein